jgi:hypothetical protein
MRAKNALLMRQAQQEFDDDQAVRRTLSGLAPTATAEDRMSALRGTGLPGALRQADAMAAAQLKTQQDQAALGKTQAETEKIKAEQATKIHGEIKKGLGFVFSNPSREAAESAIGQLEQIFGLPMDSYRQQIANLQTPEQFKQWAAGHAIEADKQLTTFTNRNTGGSTDTLAQNPVLGTVRVANSTRNTQSPDSAASVAATIRGQNMTDARAREGLALQRERMASGSTDNGKPLPTSALKMQQEALDAIGVSSSINADLGKLEQQIKDGKLSFGPVSNLANTGRNLAGMSNENSRNFATFRSNLERLRNESLRLNTGVQTDGDAQRAWNELFSSINDTDLVKQRLKEIQAINKRGVELQKLKVDSVRANYGKAPLETSGFESVPPALGDAARGTPAAQAPASGVTVVRTGRDASGRKVQQMSDGSIRYAD